MTRQKHENTEPGAAATPDAPEKSAKLPRRGGLLHQLTGSDEEEDFAAMMRHAVGGDFLAGKWFRRQLGFIALLVVLALLYTSCRYACQKEVTLHQQLCDTLLDRQYKALTISSEFKERTRGSHIEKQLADSTLHAPTNPPFPLAVSKEEGDIPDPNPTER